MNCPKCGNELKPNMKFCAKCGTPVQQSAVSVEQPAAPAQPKPIAPAPSKETAQPAPTTQNVEPQKPAKQKKAKKKSGKKNVALRIIAIILVLAVLATGGIFITDAILFKTESEKEGYITDFPVLKQDTEFLVYDAEKFPYENYNIKVDRFKTGKVFKSSTFSGFENVINDKSDNPIYNLHLDDGKYQITIENIVSERTQASSTTTTAPMTPTTPSNTQTTTTTAKTEEPVVITIIVIVDNDDEDAVDKVTINSKKDDKPIKEFEGVSTNSSFIEATDADIEEFKKWLSQTDWKNFDSKMASAQFIVDDLILTPFLGGYEYYFDESEWIPLGTESDPLSLFEKDGRYCTKIPESNVKWICENIYNVKYESLKEDVITESTSGFKMHYLHNGYYYQIEAGFGYGACWEAEIASYTVVDNRYEMIVETYELSFDDENYKELCAINKITAEIKIIDGERYWSIYKIEDYDPNADPAPTTPKNMYDENAKLYNEALKDARWGKYMPDWYGMDSYDIQTCMFDMNDDGVYELLVKFVPNSSDCYATESLLFTIKNDGVVFLHKEHDEGYRMGGTQLSIFYDNVQKKNVLVAYTAEGDGGNAGHTAYQTFDYDGTNLKEKDNYEVRSYSTDEQGYSLYKDKIDKIKSESNLYVMDGDIIRSYTLNGNYISKAEFEKNAENRFEDPTDSKLQMKQGTYENPLGLN